MNNKERLEQFRQIEYILKDYDFSKYKIKVDDEFYIDFCDDDIYLKVLLLIEQMKSPYLAKCIFNSHCQQYECQVIKNGISFDGCLWTELNMLWLDGIETIGSCCGHHIDGGTPYIQVKKEYEKDMIEKGYQPFENEYGNVLFKPKTIFLESEV